MFRSLFDQHPPDSVVERLRSIGTKEVEAALLKNGQGEVYDFLALISPAAAPYLEDMAARSMELTRQRFGRVIQMYIPMYLSNECRNICTYCGFSFNNKIERLTLTEEQILREAAVIKSYGYDSILLVTGESNQAVGVGYFEKVIRLLRPLFSHIALEVQPMDQADYETLIRAGLNTVLVYQETYCEQNYKLYHPKGKKSNFNYRLETPERLGAAGIHKMGLGVLLGLEDWRLDSFYTALHLSYLEKQFWQTQYSISFPRLRPATGCQEPKHPMDDRELLQLICAWRLFNANLELSLSTRERPKFRDHAFRLGITHMSAGSKTDPGGYALKAHALEQFEISDERSPAEVAGVIREGGYEVIWKNWDRVLG